jgi:hypothetical protein
MGFITRQTQIIYYQGSPVSIAGAAWAENVERVYHVNATGAGWVSYVPGSQYSLVSTLLPGEFYVITSRLANPNYEIVGIDIGPSGPVVLQVGLANLNSDVTTLLASKASVAEVQQLVVQQVLQAGGQVALTPFTPAAVAGQAVLWLDAGDAASLTLTNNNVTAWRNKAGAGSNFTPVGGPPTYASGRVHFNRSILSGAGSAAITGDFLVAVFAAGLDYSADNVLCCSTDEALELGTTAGGTYGFIRPQFDKQARKPVPASSSVRLHLFSFENRRKRLRVSIDGQLPGYETYNSTLPQTLPQNSYSVGGVVQVGTDNKNCVGSICEVVVLPGLDIDLLRKLEGYGRVRYGITLPPTHVYATLDPVAEDTTLPDYSPQLA